MNILDYKCLRVDKIEKSIPLIDKFIDADNGYEYLVLQNWLYLHTSQSKQKDDYYISLCISEDLPDRELCSDDITMTRLKELHHHSVFMRYNLDDIPFGIMPSIQRTLATVDFSNIDFTTMIPLEYPVHLRAQGSHNRTGYGWEWDWTDGYGDYIEGTFYGETTDFYITHILLKQRERFKSNEERKAELIATYQSRIALLKAEQIRLLSSQAIVSMPIVHQKNGNGIIVSVMPQGITTLQFDSGKIVSYDLQALLKLDHIAFPNEERASILMDALALTQKIASIEQRISKLQDTVDFYKLYLLLSEYSNSVI